jgi:GrpB-like predicted nucleotidyltransferase (UPF0157 family)
MIVIVPYDARWPDEFAAIAAPLHAVLGEQALRIDHIGSTSVPGLAAKNIIDVQLTVADFDTLPELTDALASLGYTLVSEITHDHLPPLYKGETSDWEKRYFQPPFYQRPTHLHVRVLGRPNQRYALLFRDYLRSHPATSAAYAQVKLALSQHSPDDLDFYYDVKDPLCDIIIEAAEKWAQTTRWHAFSTNN